MLILIMIGGIRLVSCGHSFSLTDIDGSLGLCPTLIVVFVSCECVAA